MSDISYNNEFTLYVWINSYLLSDGISLYYVLFKLDGLKYFKLWIENFEVNVDNFYVLINFSVLYKLFK